ncbi:phage tail sheath family protein [Myxococcus llanfairpwllgwyngyllgogerychwyrndrobwllllantysiliogogogochensis]|uniref:Phage tail sheath family protein n=1 Tax=Myxococcus llanfairpwllgwyngyllgogerychwyrndrobwllllantysiliogogogochensis TaxID=2590453 RepID=A0A540WWD1_9BACT|nr:phage tail sheath family protein [Myxococcus llanfairpwllgwyngyllgogerychwyrndrobwllllantysiliogogogochensis]NTX03421.1 phage tail sheath family protein [Myxococcus sp. CA040A]NTX11827.1 phage tail sheath family protein [Myxococcus sp. CA056]NTX34071.1 phage tail sheath family protein [Myxococcus sp. CA033]NTX56449.1 phage tail sheath family protein [Myxococcus sp. CA039A]TQF13250.1 phage tail sheath family protein [Myxococcus llanfairpwllgwyngyllgogerychwyrndrobwllllantysiliogogogochensis]
MPNYLTPGVYVEEVPSGTRSIQGVGTTTAAFVGRAPARDARLHEAVPVNGWAQFVKEFAPPGSPGTSLARAVYGFFENGGRRCFIVNIGDSESVIGDARKRQGVAVLEEVSEVAMVAAPGFTDAAAWDALLSHCEKMRDRIAILDAPEDVEEVERLTKVSTGAEGPGLRCRFSDQGYGAFYYPWFSTPDPLGDGKAMVNVPPSGHIAGIYARTDVTRGVHKAPANEVVRGAMRLVRDVTPEEQGELNQVGVNCIRYFPRGGIRVWGARTVADAASEWRYVNVRRLFNFVEESIALGTNWTVFEPNDPTLWKSIHRDVSAFLLRLWRDGALMGRTKEEAFFVQCDEQTNTQETIDAGQVIAVIGLAPVKPAEFIIFRIGQHAGGAEVEEVSNG